MASWLEKPEITIEEEEVESREHNASIRDSHMKDEEDHEENVEIVSVEEELKGFTPNARDGGNPQD